ncbi:MAG: phospho-sugar mutase [Acetivibrio ethanolgignens]
MDWRERYRDWFENSYFDEKTRAELKELAADEKELTERFYKELEFGTGGLRGIIGAGTNRMNIYTVRKATQGLANYIRKQGRDNPCVAIAYDSRHMSEEFATQAALCLCANGIRIYIFEDLRPTPLLSYAVRQLGCIAGINITASHNPPEYNGYKVYWEDGSQITFPQDKGIMDEIGAISSYTAIQIMDKAAAISAGLFHSIGKEIDDSYIETLKSQILHKDCIEKEGGQLKIIYTPLHGAGNRLVQRILKELGFQNLYVVPEQEQPDGNFPTVAYPNPESEDAFALALKLAEAKDADLVLATDPDADRLGAYVKDTKTGTYIPLTGNMCGCLLADYEVSQHKAIYGSLPEDGTLITTIVSSKMARTIAAHYSLHLIEVLTGFKFIGQKISEFEAKGSGTYLFGFEESYGCLIGTHARDKDAVMAAAALCEAAAYYKTRSMTLWDAMCLLYETYGYHKEGAVSITLEGIEGLAKIDHIMDCLRKNPPKELCGYPVIALRDYLPSSNVLYYELEEGSWLCIRPSGTEPKIKFYFGILGSSEENQNRKYTQFSEAVRELANNM